MDFPNVFNYVSRILELAVNASTTVYPNLRGAMYMYMYKSFKHAVYRYTYYVQSIHNTDSEIVRIPDYCIAFATFDSDYRDAFANYYIATFQKHKRIYMYMIAIIPASLNNMVPLTSSFSMPKRSARFCFNTSSSVAAALSPLV